MSLRKLPEIKAFDGLSTLSFEPDEIAVKRWNPAVKAALETDNTISIYDVIGEDMWSGEGVTSKRVASALRRIGGQDVVVNINSPGGDFFEGTAIYSLLRDHPHKVTVRVMGLAASAASVIAMAGDEIEISDVGFLMVHNAWAIAIGNRHDFRAAADTLEPFDEAMADLYARRSGADKATAQQWMDDETWFNASKAIDAGLADRLLSNADYVEQETGNTKSLAAIRRADIALAKQGLPRSERRALLSELKGTPDAAQTATHDAGDEWSAPLADLLKTISA